MCLSWWAQKLQSVKEQLAFKEVKSDGDWVIQQVLNSLAPSPQLKQPAEENNDMNSTKHQQIK